MGIYPRGDRACAIYVSDALLTRLATYSLGKATWQHLRWAVLSCGAEQTNPLPNSLFRRLQRRIRRAPQVNCRTLHRSYRLLL